MVVAMAVMVEILVFWVGMLMLKLWVIVMMDQVPLLLGAVILEMVAPLISSPERFMLRIILALKKWGVPQ